MPKAKTGLLLWAYPLVVLLLQPAPPAAALLAGAGFLVLALLFQTQRSPLLLFGLTAAGHGAWLCFAVWLAGQPLSAAARVIWGRFGLLGYLLLFFLWFRLSPTGQSFWGPGRATAEIRFPLIWKGRREPLWRFLLIFGGLFLLPTVFLAFLQAPSPSTLALGLVFTLVNASLEELLWRGLILPRTLDILPPAQALPITALAFGLYHFSLGFPLWACLVFAIGGFYMGGAAICSKGLLAPWLMHIVVNLLFVVSGLIFP